MTTAAGRQTIFTHGRAGGRAVQGGARRCKAFNERDAVLVSRSQGTTSDDLSAVPIESVLQGLFNGIVTRELVSVRGRAKAVVPKLLEMHRQDEAATAYGVSRASIVNAFTRYAHTVETDPFAADEIRAGAGALLSTTRGREPAPLPYAGVGLAFAAGYWTLAAETTTALDAGIVGVCAAAHAFALAVVTGLSFRGQDNGMERAETGDALAERLTVRELVRVYEEAAGLVRAGFASIAAAERLLNSRVMMGQATITLKGPYGRNDYEDPDATLSEVNRQVWFRLAERLELRRAMSPAAWEKLTEELRRGEPVPITEDAVMATLNGMLEAFPRWLEESVESVFEWLRPRRSKYKSNSEYEVPRKVVIERVIDADYAKTWAVNHYAVQELTVLENVFLSLDGRGQTTRNPTADIITAIRTLPKDTKQFSTEYFGGRVHKNGNMHLWFLRLDLLARFNRIAGGKRLKGADDLC